MIIKWRMVPEISSPTDKVFCHFRLLFVLLTPVTTWEINILKKMEETSWGIIISNMSAINKNQRVYDFRDMEHDRQNSFSFWTIFCPFTSPSSQPPTLPTQSIKVLKKWKKQLEISSFFHKWHKCTINENHMISSLRYEVHHTEYFCHFAPCFALLPPNSLKKWKFQKEKNGSRYHHFTQVCQKLWS